MKFSRLFRAKKVPQAAPEPVVDVNRKKILIVDDNPVILSALSAKLKAHGYTPVTAVDCSDAIGMVRQEKPDLILLDISFPPDIAGGGVLWDGFRLIEWLSRFVEGRNTPVIIITGSEEPDFKKRSIEAGAVAFFRKPFESDELLAVIRQTLDGIPK